MGFFRSDSKQAVEEHRQAKERLEQISRRDKTETDDYLAANRKVAESEQHVAWWRR